jgi:hypothetical protein
LVAKGKLKGVAIAALARHLLVLAYQLLTKEEPYRRVDAQKDEDKRQALAAFRPPTEKLEPMHTAWAAARRAELTGLPSPYEQAHPRARPLRRRKPRRQTAPLQAITQVIARALIHPSGT